MPNSAKGYDSSIIDHFRMILAAEKVSLIARIQRNDSSIFVEEELQDAERMDRPQIMERHNAVITEDREHLRCIETALKRCQDGTYGLCSDCQRLIMLDRLKAKPAAPRCVPCQERRNCQSRKVFVPAMSHSSSRSLAKVEKVGHPAIL